LLTVEDNVLQVFDFLCVQRVLANHCVVLLNTLLLRVEEEYLFCHSKRVMTLCIDVDEEEFVDGEEGEFCCDCLCVCEDQPLNWKIALIGRSTDSPPNTPI
jgi:hypothetical protein